MKMIKVIIAISALLVFVIGTASPIGARHTAPPPVELPDTTSIDLDVYSDGLNLLHRDGSKAEGYTFNEDGHICDADGAIVIAGPNIIPFTCVNKIIYNEAATELILPTYINEERELDHTPLHFTLELDVDPADAINTTIVIESNDPGALYFPYDENKEILGDMQTPAANTLPSITVKDAKNPVKLFVVGCEVGNYTATVRNIKDEEIGKVQFKFELEDITIPAPEDYTAKNANEHEHEYVDTVVDATFKTRGYTLHICKICGYTFRDSYTGPLACTHDYETKVIEPTLTSEGYTLYTCKLCGATKRDNFTPVKTCTHSWNTGTVTTPASCNREGVKTYRCSICGATRTESIAKTQHNMVAQVVAPTQTSEGYTRHYCSVCGYEAAHTDIVAKLPHEHVYTSSVTQPTCTNGGYTTHTCACGYSYTDSETPALGHSYSSSTVQATCESGGYTQHTCTRCGASYTDGQTAALGHDWLEHTERVRVGQEVHTFCGACGYDYTANGGFDVAHERNHVLNGESGRSYQIPVDVYDNVTTYTCSRCGATK